jgi:signal transduction histidine kinase
VEIETDIEENINFKCSKDEMERLVSILIDNAIKHSDKETAIRVKLYKSKNSINLKVINSGNPIAKGDEEKIFERFYRADKSRERSENRYGLGLAIAKKIVTNHGGTIKASSNDNDTEFKVIF